MRLGTRQIPALQRRKWAVKETWISCGKKATNCRVSNSSWVAMTGLSPTNFEAFAANFDFQNSKERGTLSVGSK